MNQILIIDDEEMLRTLLGRIIRLENFTVTEVPDLKAARKAIERNEPDVILCDVKLPDGSGVDFIKELKAKYIFPEIILLTAYANIPDGIQAMKNGAFDYLIKGNDNDKVIPLLNKAIDKVELKRKIASLEKRVGKKYDFENVIGSSSSIIEAVNLAKKVAPTDANVLLLGATGTGKEIFAQAIHHASARSSKPFIALNCSSFSKELLESELFGHKEGAFTGALKDKKGLVEEADHGTLFLDEIGEMHFGLQAKLLRVLETNEFIKVGDTHATKVDIRILAATNRDLQQEVKDLKFREDLFYRLNGFTITLPALRDRKKDIPQLAMLFLSVFSAKTNNAVRSMSKEFQEKLQQHHWKGNIRELKNIIERAVILANGPELTVENLPMEMQIPATNSVAELSSFDLSFVEKMHIQKVLQFTKGNKTETARLLNIGLTTLYRKIEEYHLS